MQCAETGNLRAFLDGELAGREAARLEEHLSSCEPCRRELETLRANASFANSALETLSPPAAQVPRPHWSQIQVRAERRARGPVTFGWRVSEVLGGLLRGAAGSRLRLAGSAIAVLVMVGLLFSLSPVQTAASSFLSIFRVKKFVAVTVDPSTLPNLASPGELGSFTVTGDKNVKSVSAAEAAKAVGFKVPSPSTLPAGLEATPRSVHVSSPVTVTFVPDLKKVRAYLATIGATNVKLPDSLDGAPITLDVPASVAVLYTEKGAVQKSADGMSKPQPGQKFLFLGATTSPTMSVPDGVDVAQLRQELLSIPGLPADLVRQLSAIDDWQNTVVVPVVKGSSEEVTVQGEKGLLVTETGGGGTSLLWMKGGVVYTLTGSVSKDEILAVANSIQ